jgi:hypothetical protein
VLAPGADIKVARLQGFAVFRFFHRDFREFRELLRVLGGEGCRHVLDQDDGARKFLGEAGCEAHHGGRPAGRSGQNNNGKALLA